MNFSDPFSYTTFSYSNQGHYLAIGNKRSMKIFDSQKLNIMYTFEFIDTITEI